MNRNIITRKTALLSKQDLESITGNEELTAEAKVIYLHLLAKSNSGNLCSPSLEELSRELQMSKNRIINHRKQLEEHGLLAFLKGGGGKGAINNAYHVVFEPLANNMNKYTDDGTKRQTDGKECETEGYKEKIVHEVLGIITGELNAIKNKYKGGLS